MRVQDGFCFTQSAIEGEESENGIHEHDRVGAMLILYTTFMNEADMSDTQRVAINKEHLERSPSPLSQLCGERTTTRVVGKSPLNTKNPQPKLRILRLASVYNCPKKYKIESQNGKYF